MTHVLRYAARTDRGLLRANNQDSVFAGDRLLVIADGMGGHAAGDVASRLVVAAFVDLDELPLGSEMVAPLTEATREGNAAIAEMVDGNPELDGMGTTLTALLFDGAVVALAHVGDSRAYLYRNGVLHQISHDDTFVQSLVDDGRITAEEAAHHPQRSLLLRALNGTEMDPSITQRETSPGDRFLICSDGLSDVVSPEAIADALAGPDPDQIADTLIQLALVGGGPDNVTVIVADVVETGRTGGFGVGGGIDPEATGPMQPIHHTQRMPRVPLPPIPEDPPAKAEYAAHDDDDSLAEYDSPNPPEVDDDAYEEGAGDDERYDGDEPYDGEDDYDQSGDPGPVASSRPGSERLQGRAMVGAPLGPRWHRRWAFALALAVLVGVGLTGSYLWAGTKYYVGDNDDQVAVFRGVNGSLLGWKFASVQENSCASAAAGCKPLKIGDLVQAARDQVSAGIPVSTLADARAVMTRLTLQQLPPCPLPGVPVTVGVTPTAPTSPTTTAPKLTTPARTTAPITTTTHSTKTFARTSTPRTSGSKSSAARTTASRTTVPPVTSTVTVTVTAPTPVDPSAGQRLRADALAPAQGGAGPITRSTRKGSRATITVFTTVTSTPAPSGPVSSGTPLVSPPAQPGVTCRIAS